MQDAAPAVLAAEVAREQRGNSAVADLRHEVYALMADVKEQREIERASKAIAAEQADNEWRQAIDEKAFAYQVEFDMLDLD